MRRHSLLGRYAPFVDPSRLARIVNASHLIAARLQPSYYPWGEAWLDLVFARGGEIALLPFVQIDPPMILVREASPFLWPSWLPLEEPIIEPLETRLLPWLLSHALLGALDEEIVGYFTDDASLRATFDAAREAKFLCAASAEDVLTDAGPYIYAQRFAAGRRVGIRANDAAYGASLLARAASTVHADLGDPERNDLARAWYGTGIFGELPRASFDVFIGPGGADDATVSIALEAREEERTITLARPIFPLLASSFDVADALPVREFSVRAREPILRADRIVAAPVIGGSDGRIGLIVRDDGLIAPEADVDEAQALAAALRAQGFDARVTVASGARAEGFDLIHLFGHRHAHQYGYLLDEARRLGVPVIVTPFFDDFGNEALWGTGAIRSLIGGIRDDATQGTIERGLAERRLLVDAKAERGSASYDIAAVQRMFDEARSAIFASASEEAEVRTRFRFTGSSRIVASVAASPVHPEPVGALCGLDEYVLVHAAIEPRANQWMSARAAAAIGVPCVLVGTVEHADYYHSILEVTGAGTVWIPQTELSDGQLESLYAAARVYADLSWAGHGPSRMVRAARHGVMPVISNALPLADLWPEATGGADPGSLESAAAVMRQAWLRAPAVGYQIADRTAQMCDPLRSLQAVLGGYAEAAGVKPV